MTPEVEVLGVDETIRSLQAIAEQTAHPLGAWGVVEQIVLAAARAAAPKRTGRLAGSGHGGNSPLSAQAIFGNQGVPYANPIHWGWRARHIKAQPFLATTVRTTEPVWLTAYEARLQAAINKETG